MRRVHDGAIGDIVAVQETYNCGPPWFRNKDRQNEWTEMEYQMRNWYVFTWLSGDHNVEQHVHSLDKAAWALNQELPKKSLGNRRTADSIRSDHRPHLRPPLRDLRVRKRCPSLLSLPTPGRRCQ